MSPQFSQHLGGIYGNAYFDPNADSGNGAVVDLSVPAVVAPVTPPAPNYTGLFVVAGLGLLAYFLFFTETGKGYWNKGAEFVKPWVPWVPTV